MFCKIKKTKKWWGTSKKFKASAIIVTFFVMLIILTTALSLALVTIKDMKASIGASKSNLAYQAADEGVEVVMYDILHSSIVSELDHCDPEDGLIKNSKYIVELLDESDERIDCDADGGDSVSTIINIKSIGVSQINAQKSERAIRVPVPSP